MMWSGSAYAQDPDQAEYEAALAELPSGSYYITTEVDGVKYYVTAGGALEERLEDMDIAEGLFTINQVDASGAGDKLFDVAWHVEGANGHFSNTTLDNSLAVLKPGTGIFRLDGSNNRNDWESQVYYLGENGKFAIRSCNTAFGESSWRDAGRAFWTYEVDEAGELVYSDYGGLMPCYSYTPAYIWTFEEPSGESLTEYKIVTWLENLLINADDSGNAPSEQIAKYREIIEDLRDEADGGGTTMNMGTGFGQCTDWDSWYELYDKLQVINAIYYDQVLVNPYPEDWPSLEQIEAWESTLDELYKKILASEVPYVMPEDGYYRIIAHNRYKSTFDESGFVDKAFAASFAADHKDKGVYGTLQRNRADYLWKLTKSESGDSILIQNAGLGTYISFSSLDNNRIIMTDDINDASHVMFDYAGFDYVEYANESGELTGEEKDCFAIRLASSERGKDGDYFHQLNHSSKDDDASPYGTYGTDSGEDQEISFWIRTYDTGRTTDKGCSEWYLEAVSEEEAAQIMEDFEAIFNHDKLVEQNQELRDKVLETLTLAKDVQKTPMIKGVNQLSSPYSDKDEGQHLEYLIDGDAGTFWHTTWHGYDEDVSGFMYNTGEVDADGNPIKRECHYLQISGMSNMVGDCELYLRERDGADNDRVAKVALMGADNIKDEDADYEEMIVLDIPNSGKGEENHIQFHLDDSHKIVRFVVIETAYSNYAFRSFWHAAEIQFYTIEENPNSQFVLMGQVAQDLQNTYDANCATADADITYEMYQALLDAYNAFINSGLVDPAELRTALTKYEKATEGVVEGQGPGQWSDMTLPNAYNELYAEAEAYNKAGKYKESEIHKYAVMLKAMQKSVMEQANGIETDKWYRIMYPTEEMFDAYEWSKEGGDKTSLIEEQGTLFGTFVTAAKEESEKVTDYDENGEEVEKTNTWLEAIGGEDLRESDRLFFMAEDEIDDKDASMFRFVETEGSATDFTPLLVDVKENMSIALDMSTMYTQGEPLITKASQFSSNAPYPGNDGGKLEEGVLIDGNTGTYWHSDYSKKYCVVPYLQVAFDEPVSGLVQVYIARRNTSNGHVVRMYVQGSNDAETWTNIGYIETPYVNATTPATSQPIDLGGSFSHLRFTLTNRAGSDGGSNVEFDPFAENLTADDYNTKFTYFHASEFQIYPLTPNVQPSASVQALQQAYNAANKVVLKDATAEDFSAAAQVYKTFKDEFNNKEGKAVLPSGLDQVPASYAIQNKATGLYVFVNGTGNQNNIYLKTIPTLVNYKAAGYGRSLLGGKNLAGQSTNYLHAGETNRRFCTWGTTDPTTNSGLIICEADEEYAVPAQFSFFKNVKPGRIIDWCHSVTISEAADLIVENGDAYTALGQYTLGEDEEAETYLALQAVLTIPAGEPALYIYGDTTAYDAEDDYMEPVKFTISGNEKPTLEGKTVNGLIGTLVTYTVDDCQIYFNANYAAAPAQGETVNVTPCSAVLDLDKCPQVDPTVNYDFSVCLGQAAKDVEVGVKDISSAIEKISKPGDVYSVDGKLLRTGATLNSLKAMGKGVYILNGVKVIVK